MATKRRRRNPSILDAVSAGSRVTIVDRFGKTRTGRAVMRGPHGWVLNMGGPHGTPGIATEDNIVKVTAGKKGYAAFDFRRNPAVARIPSRWTPARVTRLRSGQIQLRIGGRGK